MGGSLPETFMHAALKPHMGELKPDTLVTIHVVVRSPALTKPSGGSSTTCPSHSHTRFKCQQSLCQHDYR